MAYPVNKLIGIVGFMAIVLIMGSYATGILSANHDNVNVSGTAYEQSYNSSTKMQATSISLMNYTPLFMAIAALIIVFAYLKRSYH